MAKGTAGKTDSASHIRQLVHIPEKGDELQGVHDVTIPEEGLIGFADQIDVFIPFSE